MQQLDTFSVVVTTITAITAVISTVIAVWALIVARQSARATQSQADRAAEANRYTRQIGQSEAVIHFTSRFFDLMREGPKFNDPHWAYQFWSLHASEFYFFHQKWLPFFMYRLWMVELGSMYVDTPDSWASHERYLAYYSSNYPEMCDFFRDINSIAMTHRNDLASRNRKIEEFVGRWIEEKQA